MENFNSFNIEAITVWDLEVLSYFKHIHVIVEDGRISGFVEEQ
jgi:hypothetical protein